MSQKTNRRVILAKIESVYGEDSVPTGAANAIAARSVEPTPMAGDLLENSVIRPEYGNFEQVHVGTHVLLDIEVALAGAGTVDVPPAIGVLLRACGLSQTINVGVGVDYQVVSDLHESATIYYHHNRNLHRLVGARGTVTFDLNVKEYPIAKFKFVGIYVPVSDSDLPASDFSTYRQPLAIEQSNTQTFNLHSVDAVMEKLSIDLGNAVEFRSVLNGESAEITDRKVKGGITIESENVSDQDWFAPIKANALGPLNLVHGTVAGSMIAISAPRVQLLQPKYGDSQGISTLESQLSFVPLQGDDELVLTFR